MSVRVRFAPSPTGFLHVGGARTALYNWLWARKNRGTFILRIEDTDVERSTEESTRQILESLQWLGLDWDEGPYYQSRRGELYRAKLEELIEAEMAYPAFETPEELQQMRDQAHATGRAASYDRRSLRYTQEEVQKLFDERRPFIWRFRCPEGVTEIPETLMSGAADCRFDNESLGDFALTRAGTWDNWGTPLYNFCCAVDDSDLGITHVIRGSDHLTNTARQVLLMKGLGLTVPTYTHLPLIMKDNKKMSKRDEDADPRFPVSVSARRDLGYLEEATINFLALLGWSLDDKTEMFTREGLIESFSLEGLSKANPSFDEDKYLFMNGHYLRNLPAGEVTDRALPFLEAAGLDARGRDRQWLEGIVVLAAERSRLLSELPEAVRYFFEPPAFFEEKATKKIFLKENVSSHLASAADTIQETDPFTKEKLEEGLRALSEACGVGFGKIAQPIRLATTGRSASPGLFDVLLALGKDESVTRIRRAAELVASEKVPIG